MSVPSPWLLAAERLSPTAHHYRDDPVGWARERGLYLWEAQREIAESVARNRYTAVQSCHDVGKATALDTPIPTPSGWSTMDALRVGDEVFDERGKPCRVTWTARWSDRPCYRVVFDDRTSVIVDAEHEWSVTRFRPRNARRQRAYHDRSPVCDWRDEHDELGEIVSTKNLAQLLRTPWGQGDVAVPVAMPLDLPEAELPVDPYVLGIYLADGCRANGSITVAQHEADWIEPALAGRRIPSAERSGSCAVRVPGLARRLRDIGALDPKRIPMAYLRASAEQRLHLLQGIMDGDGFTSRQRGASAGIDLTHEHLAEDVLELMRSLGLRPTCRVDSARIRGRIVSARWRIRVTQTLPVFALPSKVRERVPAQMCRRTQRMVVAVEPVANRDTKCISVDSPSHLYLCGEGMVPTHNSFESAVLAAWWLDVHPLGEAFVVTTAPTGPQVYAILWREMSALRRRLELPGRITLDAEWYMGPRGAEQLVAYGRKPADYDQAAFQGIHARYVLVIADEACGVPRTLYDAIDSLATNEAARVLAIGNPDDPAAHFARICAPGSGWNHIQVGWERVRAALESGDIPETLADLLISETWVAERKRRWGERSPTYVAKVLGEFPEVSDDALIAPALIRAAQEREFPTKQGPARLGVDVARSGSDETVAYLVNNQNARLVHSAHGHDTMRTAGVVANLLRTTEHVRITAVVDIIGVGAGVYDRLVEQGLQTVPFDSGARPRERDRFANQRAECYWDLRQRFVDGEVDIDPADEDLAAQLGSVRWFLDSRGRIHIESKEDMKKRGLPSPDRADALMMAFADSSASYPPTVVSTGEPAMAGYGMEL